MGIPVGNIYGFFTEEDASSPVCEQVDVYEDITNGSIEFHFENGVIVRIEEST